MAKKKLVPVREYAEKHNPLLSRRGHKMSPRYIWKVIQDDIKGNPKGRTPWFKYKLTGEKDNIWIEVEAD